MQREQIVECSGFRAACRKRFEPKRVSRSSLGCRSKSEARRLYLSAPSAGWKALRSLVAMTRGQFLKWLDQDRATKKPAVERYAFDPSQMRGAGGRWVR